MKSWIIPNSSISPDVWACKLLHWNLFENFNLTIIMIVIVLLGLVVSINSIRVINQDLNDKGWWIDDLTHLILYKRIPSAHLVLPWAAEYPANSYVVSEAS